MKIKKKSITNSLSRDFKRNLKKIFKSEKKSSGDKNGTSGADLIAINVYPKFCLRSDNRRWRHHFYFPIMPSNRRVTARDCCTQV